MFLFIVLMLATLGLLGSRKVVLDKYKQDVRKDIEENIAVINTGKIDKSGASTPVLLPTMIPVVYNGTAFVKAEFISEYDQDWYNYDEKKWANAVTIKPSARSSYNNVPSGTIINSSDILAYYVWIPRYRYKLFNADFNNLNSNPQLIDIVFESSTTLKSISTLNGEYLTHPAFTFDNVELSGFWIGKFETTGTIDNISVLPNSTPILNYNVKQMYDATKNNASNFGVTTGDMHMSKDNEWGAVAYLSHSLYGQGNIEIRKNAFNNSGFKTGCGSNTTSNAPRTAACEMGFGSSTDYPQSTTGNIYGVFDMSGGSWEYVTGYISGKPGSSEFTPTSYNSKYFDVYNTSSKQTTYQYRILGDAT